MRGESHTDSTEAIEDKGVNQVEAVTDRAKKLKRAGLEEPREWPFLSNAAEEEDPDEKE